MVKDAAGNILKEGDRILVKLADLWNQATITEITQGGSVIPLGKNQAALMAGKVVLTIKAIAHYDPREGIVTELFKIHQEVKVGE